MKCDDIEAIYKAYPRHVGKKAALAAIERAIRDVSSGRALLRPDAVQFLIQAATEYAQAVAKWPAEQRVFIPYPSTWFNQARYDDDRSEWVYRGKDAVVAENEAKHDEALRLRRLIMDFGHFDIVEAKERLWGKGSGYRDPHHQNIGVMRAVLRELGVQV